MISATCADNWASIVAIASSSFLSIVIDGSPRAVPKPVMKHSCDVRVVPRTGDARARARGMTLYVYDPDRFNRSQCSDACARRFPPFGATENAQPAGDFALARREDGSLQWTHRGRPLYTFSGDAAPGDVTGLGAGSD